jgi:hypothetical protein
MKSEKGFFMIDVKFDNLIPRVAVRLAPVLLMIAGLLCLTGHHSHQMTYEPRAWMLFLGILLLFGANSIRVSSLEQRIIALEFDRMRASESPTGGPDSGGEHGDMMSSS